MPGTATGLCCARPAAFLLHALFGAIETARTEGDQQRAGLLLTWTAFHLGIAILLTVASR